MQDSPPKPTIVSDNTKEGMETQAFLPTVAFSTNGHTSKGGSPLEVKDRITFCWKNLSVSVPAKNKRRCCGLLPTTQPPKPQKEILKNVSGIVRPGELLAIMGASGAGKSTLLNALTFRNLNGLQVSGSRIANNRLVTPNSLTSLSAYVQQDDLFIGTLTVREHLTFQALVRMDKNIPYEERMKRVNEVVAEMGLGKAIDTLIGVQGRIKGISGGESKRLALASELLTNPPLMFCDEPTSGLDSFMAGSVVDGLKKLAKEGRTVICTIHQPSSQIYASFDRILLMAEGQNAFLGKTLDAKHFFTSSGHPCPENFNPSDHFIQVLAVVPGDEEKCRANVASICKKFEESEQGIEMAKLVEETEVMKDDSDKSDSRSPYKSSWGTQFKALMWRSWLSVIKEPLIVKMRIVQTVFMALILGFIYFGQNLDQAGIMNMNGAIFLFITNMTFSNMFAVVNVFCRELPIFLREHFNGMYRTDTYFLSKQFAELPLFLVTPLIFCSIMYFMVGLDPKVDKFFINVGIVELVVQVVVSFGYFISCLSSSVDVALGIAPAIIVPFMLFGGFFLNNESVPVWLDWIKHLSWFKYSNSGLLINQWTGIDNITCPAIPAMREANIPCISTGEQVLVQLGFADDEMWFNCLMLAVLAIAYRMLAFFALLMKTYRKKN